VRVAYTLEQCWHDVPGGTAVATLRVATELTAHHGIELVGVAGRHRHPAVAGFEPTVPVSTVPLARPLLYDAWIRLRWPLVESATGPVDLCHSTAGIPAPSRAPAIVTLHDVAFLRRPDRLTRRGARVLTRAVDRARSARLITCPSATVARELAERGFAEERIRVIPWGVDPHHTTADDIARARDTHHLPADYVLAVGTLEPRKNLRRLIAAMEHIDLPLVVAGADGWGGIARELADSSDVRFLGHVDPADLPALYSAAQLLAYPSEDEGFGLPVLEAMSAGTPVVTSRGTATEDVAGGAAVLVDPYDTDSITAGIQTALADRERLIALGHDRATQHTWAATAAATATAYREALG